jgi:hypothetical protein
MNSFVNDLVDEVYGDHLEVGMITIEPKTGKKVKIVSGQWWGEYGLSNFFDWREILPDGSLGEEKFCGYGWQPR